MFRSIGKLLKLLVQVSIIKTLYFNFHYLPIVQAIHLPILVFRGTKLAQMKGNVIVDGVCKFANVLIGKHGVGILDFKKERTIWQNNNGTVVFNGRAFIGSGARISVNKEAILTFGKNFCITGGSSIICSKAISFGENCLLSWDILIMDTDFHNIIDSNNIIVNKPKPITIGDHVWIGCRSLILKGVSICNDVVIAAGCRITKDITAPHVIVGGGQQRVVKDSISWKA